MFKAGDKVQVNTGGQGGRLWEDGTVSLVRPDGKLSISIERTVGETVSERTIVRGTAFVREPVTP